MVIFISRNRKYSIEISSRIAQAKMSIQRMTNRWISINTGRPSLFYGWGLGQFQNSCKRNYEATQILKWMLFICESHGWQRNQMMVYFKMQTQQDHSHTEYINVREPFSAMWWKLGNWNILWQQEWWEENATGKNSEERWKD